ncbi:hypothetical protein BTO30_03625 [Domibacillus antri]|uniref:Uncharacterized protein n=1 Tax=Domibacillus antri TaxID=1714264 RepID=A0A1Q8Q8L5_9BACI|nr:hypothetical protein BTO30_03625 [Domibacillus antri]
MKKPLLYLKETAFPLTILNFQRIGKRRINRFIVILFFQILIYIPFIGGVFSALLLPLFKRGQLFTMSALANKRPSPFPRISIFHDSSGSGQAVSGSRINGLKKTFVCSFPLRQLAVHIHTAA